MPCKPTTAVKRKRSTASESKRRSVAAKPALLTGGNPQIAKADGDAPVRAVLTHFGDLYGAGIEPQQCSAVTGRCSP